MPSFIVRVRSTVIEDYTVDAENEDEARQKMKAGDSKFSSEVERPDWEIESVLRND